MAERLPFADLERIVDTRHLPGTVAHVLGISGATANRYRREGLSVKQADTLACRAGLHPANVWPDQWVDSITDLFARLRKQLSGTRWAA